ncbi:MULTISPECIES: riboflavin biosynthesis protein RibF [Psychrobacillus]|uniref:Riboflavin biosynthesis protein n=1 Tax=Psychrobacillus faecigallinarum TaxID=2762235 RepID=A0ABR8R4H6_9BACI|nr:MULTISPECIES: riboflavin biosynthesis protein RibF [Psychrobacillus]MBD7942651.1 riboflavin biosynthesis protein RibF [Psychrobacillus faecigallinarum]QEY20131.1 riboflavin biosynthesis protein RibF [Psychrobacillus sp. AK 1817]
MNVYHLSYPNHLYNVTNNEAYSLAIGFFDGVHTGHRAVIQEALNKGKEKSIKTAVMTFDPHPSLVLGGRKEQVFYITPLEQKIEILEQMNVDALFVVRFTSDFAKLSPAQFIDSFIKHANVKHVTAGFDFTFGSFGKGTMQDMEELSNGEYSVSIVGKQELAGDKISSTRIREALKEGKVEVAKELLGRPFMLSGVVVHGDKRGRTIDFPTANIQPKEGQFTPAIGVYAVKIQVQEIWYEGVCNVGYKPTFNNPEEKKLSIEVHIINFDQSIYGEEVSVHWYKRIRAEQKFNGIDELKKQIGKDKNYAMEYFKM